VSVIRTKPTQHLVDTCDSYLLDENGGMAKQENQEAGLLGLPEIPLLRVDLHV